jgi:hypothetical protein
MRRAPAVPNLPIGGRQEPKETPVNVALLRIYLNDHLAGSMAGLELARRARSENEGSPLGDYLGALVSELEEDRATLEGVMSALRLKRDLLKSGLGWVGEKLGRLKLNGQWVGYSPLSRVVELEALCLGAEGRLSMWRTLKRLTRKDERLGRFDFTALIIRAEHQRRNLERLRQQATDDAFQDKEGSVVPLTPSRGRG